MKVAAKPVEVIEVENAGFMSLLGQQVEIGCNVYIYVGILTGVNDEFIQLEDAAIVYETGPLQDARYKDAQRFYKYKGTVRFIQKGLIENFGVSTKAY